MPIEIELFFIGTVAGYCAARAVDAIRDLFHADRT